MTALNVEGRRHNADHQGACGLGFLGHDGANTGSRTSAKTRGDEDQISPRHDASNHFSTGFSTSAAGGGVASCAQPSGDVAAHEQLLQGSGVVEVLLVGVDGHGHGAFHTEVRDTVQGVVARAAATDDENARVRYAKRADFLVHEGRHATVHGVGFESVDHVGKRRVVGRGSARCS